MQKNQEIGDYVLIRTIGTGASGKVKLAEHKTKHTNYAIKIIKKTCFETKPDLQVKIRRETALMRLLDHPHLLKLAEICESPRHLYIVLEYAAHGELFDYLIARRALTVDEAMKFFRQIIYGLDYLHSHSICHRDLKPENILLDENDNIKIADFGFARWMKRNTVETSCGSPHYAAPEIVKGIPYDGRMADIWSCGVILYALLAGRLPFDEPNIRNLVTKVKLGQFRMPDFHPDIQNLISRMLTVEPTERITIEQIKHHKAFKKGLPNRYTVPSPLPVPIVEHPIDPSTVDQSVLNVIKQIGFSDDNLIQQLNSEGASSAKSFCLLLTRQTSLDSLPWEEYFPPSSPEQDIAFLMAAEPPPPVNFVFPKNDPFFRRKFNDSGSLGVYSMIERSSVFENSYLYQGDQSYIIPPMASSLENIVSSVQGFLLDSEYDWLYPNDITLFARKSRSQGPYYAFHFVFEKDYAISIKIFVQGGSSSFEQFCSLIVNAVSSNQ